MPYVDKNSRKKYNKFVELCWADSAEEEIEEDREFNKNGGKGVPLNEVLDNVCKEFNIKRKK